MIKLPFVSREAYEDVRADRDALSARFGQLLEQHTEMTFKFIAAISELRRDGFQAKAPPSQRVQRELTGTPDLDEVGQEGAKREFVERMEKDLGRIDGVSPTMARQEAERMASAMYNMYGPEGG